MKEYSEEARRFYRSKAWQQCRAAYIKSVGGLCERCLAKGFIKPGYICHHKKYLDGDKLQDPEVALSFDNLEYLCLDCHNAEHFRYKNARYAINDDGTVKININS